MFWARFIAGYDKYAAILASDECNGLNIIQIFSNIT